VETVFPVENSDRVTVPAGDEEFKLKGRGFRAFPGIYPEKKAVVTIKTDGVELY